MDGIPDQLVALFAMAVEDLDQRFSHSLHELDDLAAERRLRQWLDGEDLPLPWEYPDRVTPDEWFLITTLYGQLNVKGQRTVIRKYFPTLFVEAARRRIRNFLPEMPEFSGLPYPYMKKRLCDMGALLQERGISMEEYVEWLRQLDHSATIGNPTPALDAIIHDLRVGQWKTLSVFVRDCVKGNCFPIDSRVLKELRRHWLSLDERLFVQLAMLIGRNPRQIARMFYEAGGE